MKKIMLSAMLFVSVGSLSVMPAYAQAQVELTENGETPVKVEELPEQITKVLQSEEFAEWKVEKAALVKEESGEYYKLDVVSKDGQKQTINLKEDGSLMEG